MLNVTCLACGCLCDDIGVVTEDGRIVEAERACSIGRAWFLAARTGEEHPVASIDGQPAELEQAIERAAEILRVAKAPVVWGLSGTTVEAVASALAIADRIGAVVDLAGSSRSASKLEAFQRVGQVSASLGEVKDRADVVVFWRVDPLTTHPRHWERYSVEPKGRFVPEGRAGRFVIVVDAEPSETSRAADLFVQIDLDRQGESLDILRALVRGVAVDPERASRSARVPFSDLDDLAIHLKAARYGALFFGDLIEARAMESLLKLVRDLNEGRRFVALELGSAGNASGAASVLSWQAGAASAVDYGLGYPRHLPREAMLAARLNSGDADALLIVGDDLWSSFTPDLLTPLTSIPTILVGPRIADPGRATVAFPVARPGIESGGTVARVDGVMLPLRPSISTSLPSDRQILDAIYHRLELNEP